MDDAITGMSAIGGSATRIAIGLAVLQKGMQVQAETGAALVANLAPTGAAADQVQISSDALAALMAELGSGTRS